MMPDISRREFLRNAALGAAAVATGGMGLTACVEKDDSPSESRPPNIVLIFTDDQGYADVGCYGARGFSTPNLDRMASEGMRFTHFYAAQAVCSASRAALLTGCYSNRVSILGALMPQATHGLHPDETTIAEVLKQQGYACAAFGKWHLGHHRPFLPLQHGFDEYLGLPYSNDMWPLKYDGTPADPDTNKGRHPWLPLIDGNETVEILRTPEQQDRLTTRYTERAVRFIEANHDRPFFLYVPHSMPHTPLGVSEKFKGKSEYGRYGDVIMEIDWSVGKILDALRRHGLDDNTLVIFTSDNGPWLNFGTHAGTTGPLRGAKGNSWEGGMRVPCIMRWPGRIPAAAVCERMAATMDILPTAAALAGAPLPDRKIDGKDLGPLLRGDFTAEPRRRMLYYYGKQLQGVREGRWKLVLPHQYRRYEGVKPGVNGLPGPYARGETGLELYDLETDPGERRDVSREHPDVVERLSDAAEEARAELGDIDREGAEVRPHGRI